ncbi:hypothetical protein COO60DRAFT_1665105 [Scenedesmus sp. NREL 46B-D3]|nr:hypothetical protein COO60DRAFT_1665105 [Scenedesmus sp. NREL 46B-D3]
MDTSVNDNLRTSCSTLFELLEVGFAAGAWSLLDVCCMCASSKLLCSSWMQLLRRQPSPTWLLAAVADAAQAKTPALQKRAAGVVIWLLNRLPSAQLAKHPRIPAGLLAIPCIPIMLAEQLSSSGVCIPYASIVAAARARVEGVEGWVEAQQVPGNEGTIDVPDVARAVCQGILPDDNLLETAWTDPQELHDLLHIAFNSSDPAVARAGLMLMPPELPDDEALTLLQTAVERHSTSRPPVLRELVQHLEDYDHLAVLQLLPVLLCALELDARVPHAAGEPDPYLPALRLWQLGPLPVFAQLSPDGAAGLLEKALTAGDRRSVQLLWNGMPAVQAVSPARLAELLQAAAAAGDLHSLRLLARLPAFHEVQSAELAAAMMPAVKAGHELCVWALQDSRAAAQLAAGDCEVLLELLTAALHADQPGMVPVLLRKSAGRINLKRLMVLLQAALQHCPAGFNHLYQLPAAASIQAKELGQLLRWAGRWFRHGILYEVLNWHRAWSRVSAEDKLVGLLQLALQQGAACHSFCTHPCASAVDEELTMLLLHFAVVTEQRSNLEALLLLPAAAKLSRRRLSAGASGETPADFSAVQQLCGGKAAAGITSVAELQPLLELVLSNHDHVSVGKLLENCPAAAAVNAAILAELLQHTFSDARYPGSAVQHQVLDVLVVQRWPAALAGVAGLSAEQQDELQQAAAAVAGPGVLSLPVQAVAQMAITQELLQVLLIRAIMLRDDVFAVALCKCRAAAHMSSSSIKAVLTAAAAAAAPYPVGEEEAAAAGRTMDGALAAAAGQYGTAAGSGAGVAPVLATAAVVARPRGKAGRRFKKAHRRGGK